MIVLSAANYDPVYSPVCFKGISGSKLSDMGRRAKRVATLDGGAVLADYGFTDADRTVTVVTMLSSDQLAAVEMLLQLYSEHVLSTCKGLFYGVLSDVKYSNGKTTMTFLVVERLD